MLTIFSLPKPFHGDIECIQTNAIQSWIRLRPPCQIILCGDEPGTQVTASELGVDFLPHVGRNEYGTPLLHTAFRTAEEAGRHATMCYVNADIILMSDFVEAVRRVGALQSPFLMVGRRWDVELREPWRFGEYDWEMQLRERVARTGKLHRGSGCDYFVYPRGAIPPLPPFAVGRPGWDNWIIYQARKAGIPVVDVTKVAVVVHQNHGYGHMKYGRRDSWEGAEAEQNRRLGDSEYTFTLFDATHILTPRSLLPALTPAHLLRRLLMLAVLIPWLGGILRRLRTGRRRLLSAIRLSGKWRL